MKIPTCGRRQWYKSLFWSRWGYFRGRVLSNYFHGCLCNI